ncbi:sugar-phosphate kinase, partial [Enterococcus sp. S181_ASV_20]|nr:sugar-phosphate kinase [Enterococcus sp. S181_ASV_20]
EQKELTVDQIMEQNDAELQAEILDIAGHYTFNDDEVKAEIEKMYKNLKAHNIDGQRYVVDHIKRPIRDLSLIHI